MTKAVLFDMDGILYDSEGFYMKTTSAVMRRLGYKGPEERLYDVIGATSEKTWKILYDLLDGEYSGREIERAWIAHYRENPLNYREAMFADIPDTLKRLKRHGFAMACCSSSSRRVIEDSLEAMEIRGFFSYVVSGEDIEQAKPDPMIYLLAAEEVGAKPEDCYVYEDSAMGIEAGVRAGMTVIARKDDRFFQDQSRAHRIVMNAAQMAEAVIAGEGKNA